MTQYINIRAFKLFNPPFSKMIASSAEVSTLMPPKSVSKMTIWKPELFDKIVEVSYLNINAGMINKIQKQFKPYFLKMPNLKCIRDDPTSLDNENTHQNILEQDYKAKQILLNPEKINSFNDFSLDERKILIDDFQVSPNNDFGKVTLKLDHSNYHPQSMLKAVLGEVENLDNVSGYSYVGHVCHLNLREEAHDYKHVIGQILLQLPNIRTVVNKSNNINNTYRNFSMEILAGINDFNVTVKENYVKFQFDFSKVYWNPRLSTEHSRLVSLLKRGDFLYDVFAGVGPFSILAAVEGKPTKKQPQHISIFANDLNPDSYKSLKNNIKLNQVEKTGHIKCYNKDGRLFILEEVKEGLLTWFQDKTLQRESRIHIAMNLPAIAISFLDTFLSLLKREDVEDLTNIDPSVLPMVHVYAFSNADDKKNDLKGQCELKLATKLDNIQIDFVRNVAPNKDMFRISIPLTTDILFSSEVIDMSGSNKRLKLCE